MQILAMGDCFQNPSTAVVLQDAFILTMVGQEDPTTFLQLVLPAMTKAMVDAEIDSEELKFAGD